jgi:hypothetical protein
MIAERVRVRVLMRRLSSGANTGVPCGGLRLKPPRYRAQITVRDEIEDEYAK